MCGSVRSSAAQRRITKEWAEIQADFPPHVEVSPDENNLFHWTGILTGPDESAYKGGKFKIDITFPNEVSSQSIPVGRSHLVGWPQSE